MTPKRPIELVEASKACAEAWIKRDILIEAGDKVGVLAMDVACAILQERYDFLYRQWQEVGGTSNIDSIAFPPQFVDAWCDERVDTGVIELNATYRPAVWDDDDLPF